MSQFNSKEEHTKFISAWKSASNAEECKSIRIVCDHRQCNWSYCGFTGEEKARFEDKGYKNITKHHYTIPDGAHRKTESWLHAPHYLMYNVMLGKNLRTGFTPKISRKVATYESPWHGFVIAVLQLEIVVRNAKKIIEEIGKGHIMKVPSVDEFLMPFSGRVTIVDLAKINISELVSARKFINNLTKSMIP